MLFEWDENKNRENKRKHGIDFETAVRVFLDERKLEIFDMNHSTFDEERYNVIGMVDGILVVFVACTDRNGKTRIISARKARPNEKEKYYENYDA